MLTSELRAATVETLTAELARLESGDNLGGPLVAAGYRNVPHAIGSIQAELARRSEPAAVSAKPSEPVTTLPDPEQVFAARRAACNPAVQADPASGKDDQAGYPPGIDAQQIYAARRN